MPGGRANAAIEPDAREVLRDMLRRGTALRLIRGIGRNRSYSQQSEQPIETLLEILIDAVEDSVEGAHGGSVITVALIVRATRHGHRPVLQQGNAPSRSWLRGARSRLCSGVVAFKIAANPSKHGDVRGTGPTHQSVDRH